MDRIGESIRFLRTAKGARVLTSYVPFLVARVMAVCIQFVCVFVLARYVEPTLYGQFSLVLTIPVITNQLLFGPLSNAMLRYLPQARTRFERTGLLISSLLLALGSVVFMALGYIVSAELGITELLPRSSEIGRVREIGVVGLLLAGSSGIGLVCVTALLGFRRRIEYGIAGVIEVTSKLVAYLMLASLGLIDIGTLVGAAIFGQLASVLFVSCWIARSSNEWLSWRGVNTARRRFIDYIYGWSMRLTRFSMIFVGWGTLGWIQAVSDKWFLTFANRIDELGIYSLALQISYAPAAIALGATTQYLLPKIYRQSKKDLNSGKINEWLGRRFFSVSIVCTMVGGWCVYIAGMIMLDIGLISPQYGRAVGLMAPLFLSACLFFIAEIIKEELIITNRKLILIIVKVIYFCVAVTLNWVACNLFPLEVIAWFNALASIVYVIIVRISVYNKTT